MGKLIDADKLLAHINSIRNDHIEKRNEGDECDRFANDAVADWLFIISNDIEKGTFDPDPIPLPTIKPGDKDVDTANLIADLLFAFINKDVYCPHDFEIKAFKNALNVLCKHYGQIKYNPRLFEDYLQSMMEVSHD